MARKPKPTTAIIPADGQTDPTTAADRRHMRVARAEARARVREIKCDGRGSMRDVFRQEVGTTIRSASPFLLSLIESQAKSVDEIVDRIEPSWRWPRSPSLSRSVSIEFRRVRDTPRYYLVGTTSGWEKAVPYRGFGHRISFMRSGDDWANLEIVNHSLEVEARIGPARFETLFGTLRIQLECRLPETLAVACVGRLVGDVLDHAAVRGRDWRVTGVDDSESPFFGQTLVVATGSTAYRMPWVR